MFDCNLALFAFVLKLVMAAFNIHQMHTRQLSAFNQLRTIHIHNNTQRKNCVKPILTGLFIP
jgi:hypothetical protein